MSKTTFIEGGFIFYELSIVFIVFLPSLSLIITVKLDEGDVVASNNMELTYSFYTPSILGMGM